MSKGCQVPSTVIKKRISKGSQTIGNSETGNTNISLPFHLVPMVAMDMVHVVLQQENVVERSSKVYDLSQLRSYLLDVYEMLDHEVRVQNPWQAHSDIVDEEMFYVDLDAKSNFILSSKKYIDE